MVFQIELLLQPTKYMKKHLVTRLLFILSQSNVVLEFRQTNAAIVFQLYEGNTVIPGLVNNILPVADQ